MAVVEDQRDSKATATPPSKSANAVLLSFFAGGSACMDDEAALEWLVADENGAESGAFAAPARDACGIDAIGPAANGAMEGGGCRSSSAVSPPKATAPP